MDSKKTVLKSVSHFFTGTLVSRVSGALRDIAMAYTFGAEAAIASFFVAYRLAHFFRRMLGEGALQSALIPKFEELRLESPQRACKFYCDLYFLTAFILLAIIAGSISCGRLFLASGAPGEAHDILSLSLLMMPSLFFICLFGLNSALLQCEKSYFLPAIAPVFFNLVWIAGACLLFFLQPEHPMYWLAITIIAACIAQWAVTLPKTWSLLKAMSGSSLFSAPALSQDIKALGKPLLLGVVGIAASQINNALDSIFAKMAAGEGPAHLWYAVRIQQLPLALFAIAFSGAVLPPLSRAVKANDTKKFKQLLGYAVRKCAIVMIPCTALLFFFGSTGIQLVYGRGNFDAQAIAGTTYCLNAYLVGLLPMSLVLLLAPAFYAHNNYSTPAKASVVSVLANILLSCLFVMKLGFGAASVALATSMSAWINVFLLALALPGMLAEIGTYAKSPLYGK